ncbi:MAG: glycoside hydrolase family 65 protein [Prevotella sp.]|nr:glycoside hydrolase family 65 protein [Prevotella sp.]
MKRSVIFFMLATLLSPLTSCRGAGIDAWRITANLPTAEHYYGETVANGMIGLVSAQEPLKIGHVVMGGVYDVYGKSRVTNFLHSINPMDLELRADGTRLSLSNIQAYTQTLDMRHGWFEESFDHDGKLHVDYRYTALRQLPFTLLGTVILQARTDVEVTLTNVLTVHDTFRNPNEFFSTITNGDDQWNICTSTALSPTGAVEEAASSAFLTPPVAFPLTPIHQNTRNVGQHTQEVRLKLKAGEQATLSVVANVVSSITHRDLRNEAERLTVYACLQGVDELWRQHEAAWDGLWQSDIEIEGDAQSQQDVHSMLYHCYAFLREGSRLSVSPMGLSGLGYNGHVFWDADTWVFPAVAVMRPELARSIIDYRSDRLDAARQNAYMHGYRGAMFPWESSATGFEDNTVHNVYGPLEHHVTADVALAVWQYYCLTHQADWLATEGYPILSAAADFWASRVTKTLSSHSATTYEIRGVIGADEWGKNSRGGKNVDNNAYTIGAAKTVLLAAIAAAKLVGTVPDPCWKQVADGLQLRQMANGVTAEHDEYTDDIIKQADVNLLAYPLSIVTDKQQIRRDLDFYASRLPEKRTPAMSKSIFSILYGRIGEPEKAWQYFKESYEPNLNSPFRVIAEFNGGTNPYFITGAGGTLQAILMGFAGLEITPSGLRKGPTHLPRQWKSLTIKSPLTGVYKIER